MGLALAKALVDMHGGSIEGHSEGVGKGAEFIIKLPLTTGMAEQSSSSEARKVLVVDDNPDHVEILADLLERRGYEVVKASDASEALRHNRTQAIDLFD